MTTIGCLVALALALTALTVWWRRHTLRQIGRQRLVEREGGGVTVKDRAAVQPFIRRHQLAPWGIGLVVGVGLYSFVGLAAVFAATFGLIAALLASQLETFWVSRLTWRIEEQLADAIDLLVATLHAGAGVTSALESAVREAGSPIRPHLEELLGRIRGGDDPQNVLRALQARVPLETFRLFVSALSVHWETGGSVAPTLATVGRVIRDRLEISRRIRAVTSQARASLVAVFLLTYFIALVIWRNDPERMQQFLATSIGQLLVAGAVLLQAVGLVWSSMLIRVKY